MSRRTIQDDDLSQAFEVDEKRDAAPSRVQDDPLIPMQLPVDIRRVRTRVLNPRVFPNPKREMIKASLRAQGVTHLWPITRRPGDDFYITFAGGDTRTELLQALCEETGDPRFCQPTLFFRPWTAEMSEADVLGGAITENLAKGEMCLFETAASYLRLKTLVEAELRRTGELAEEQALRASHFVTVMETRGVPCSTSAISRYIFLLEYFDGLPDGMKPALTNDFVKEAQPRFTRYGRLLEALGHSSPGELVKAAVASMPEGIFSAMRLYDHMNGALAEITGKSPEAIETAIRRLADRRTTPAKLFPEGARGDEDEPSEPVRRKEEPISPPGKNETAAEHADPAAPPEPAERPALPGSVSGKSAPAEPAATPTPPKTVSSPTLEEIHDQVLAFAQATGVHLAVRRLPDDPMAFGFFMELLPLEQDAQRIAWWLLAMHSFQLLGPVIEQLIPHTTHWYKAVTADPDASDAELITATVGTPTSQNLMLLPAGFLFGPGLSQAARTQWVGLTQTLHTFQCANPERFRWQILGGLEMEGRVD